MVVVEGGEMGRMDRSNVEESSAKGNCVLDRSRGAENRDER